MLKSLQTDIRTNDEQQVIRKKLITSPPKNRLKNLTKRENKTKLKKRGK